MGAYGVRADGVREVLGMDVTAGEHVVFWRAFLQGLVARGLRGVRLVISDAHPGLRQAIREVFVGAAWQRCRMHCMRNVLARAPKKARAMVAATVRSIFAQPDRARARAQLGTVIETLAERFPAVVELLIEAEDEGLTFYDFPAEHRRQIASTNPLERLNKELKRRSAVVGIFPNRAAGVRLLGAVLMEQHEEWLVGRCYFSETSMRRLREPAEAPGIPQVEAGAA